jgi:hypothetical protein
VSVLLTALGGLFIFKIKDDPFRALRPIDMQVYLDNANSLRGNVYKVEGTVVHLLAWRPDKGRLISVQVDARAGFELLPIVIPVDFSHVNIQKGQTFFFRVGVGEGGVVTANAIEKA